ncbi:hypothetical protein TNCV_595461 [Trichonephila clavipes]|nr:hypothetical protein TNCV_595461 [Trichonephila clavipes]
MYKRPQYSIDYNGPASIKLLSLRGYVAMVVKFLEIVLPRSLVKGSSRYTIEDRDRVERLVPVKFVMAHMIPLVWCGS